MQFTLAALTVLLPLASAMVLPRASSPHIFKLKPTSTEPKIAGKYLTWDMATNSQNGLGPLGWYTTDSNEVSAFVQLDATSGIVFDSTNTARSFYIRGGKEAILGNPNVDPSSETKVEDKWVIKDDKFGWDGKFDQWHACERGNGWQLLLGEGGDGCTGQFDLEVEWTN